MNDTEAFMDIAIAQAKKSLKVGNSGFGAVIVKDGRLISKAYDTDKTTRDPTAHAELTAIRLAANKLKGDLNGCLLVCTHEPCPMCATAIVWAGIEQVAFGYTIKKALAQGRKRIDLSCQEIFERAGAAVTVRQGVKAKTCALLYDRQVRKSIAQLRNTDSEKLKMLSADFAQKRIDWFSKQPQRQTAGDLLDQAYALFLEKLNLTAAKAPIVKRQKDKIVIHSQNFCPTLEACKILDLDTRFVCKTLTEIPMQALLKQLSPKLIFKRNYDRLRPQAPYCEEMIMVAER